MKDNIKTVKPKKPNNEKIIENPIEKLSIKYQEFVRVPFPDPVEYENNIDMLIGDMSVFITNTVKSKTLITKKIFTIYHNYNQWDLSIAVSKIPKSRMIDLELRDDDILEITNKIITAIKETGSKGITLSELHRKTQKINATVRKNIIKEQIGMNQINVEIVNNSKKKTQIYRYQNDSI